MFYKILILVTVFSFTEFLAQIDTTLKEFWPLGLGDTWQYHNQTGEISTYLQVVNEDTVLSNGLSYAKAGVPPNFSTGFDLTRIDSLLRVQWYTPSIAPDSCGGSNSNEYSVYHLDEIIGSIWVSCWNWNGFLGIPFVRYDGIYTKSIFGQARETMIFKFGFYDSFAQDTVFVTEGWLVRGIGLYRREYWHSGGYEILTGAIINGIQYGTIVSINEIPETIPQKITLYQNYPNPFNPVTSIQFSIPVKSNVTLTIYNTLGQKIKTLISNEEKLPGNHNIEFDGNAYSSGIYFYSLQTENFLAVRKMLLIK